MNLEKMIDSFTLTTLSHEKNLYVITMTDQLLSEEDKKENQSPYNNIKLVVARTHNIGLIIDKTYFVKPEWFKGGVKYQAYIENETALIVKMYQLERVIPIKEGYTEKMLGLDGLLIMAKREVDYIQLGVLASEAKALAQELQNESATAIYNQINKLYMTMGQAEKKDPAALALDLFFIVDQIKDCYDEKQIQELLREGSELLKLIPDGDTEVRSAGIFINDLINKSKDGPLLGSKKDPGSELTEEDKNKEVNDLLKRGEQAFDKKDWKKARNIYGQVLKLNPNSGQAQEKLALIKTMENLGK